jgi:hypothetical protein
MIAAARPRIGVRVRSLSAAALRWSRRLDGVVNRGLERAHPVLLQARGEAKRLGTRAAAFLGPRLRPLGALFFGALARGERAARRAWAAAMAAATRASAPVTPRRAVGAVAVAAGACLVVSQFIDYRGVEIGQPGYAGLPSLAAAPTVGVRTAGQAHAYLLVPVGVLAALIGLVGARRWRRGLGLALLGLGLLALGVILLVDLPAGLDESAQSARFAGASAILEDGFYAELAAASGLVLAGLLYYARPCRIPISSSGRAASARRRRPRRRASSRARVARSA